MIKKWYILVIMILSITGIILSGVLTLAKYNDTIAALCGEDEGNSCNVVQNSDYAYLINVKNDNGAPEFQVPVSLTGLLFYTILLILSIILFFNLTQIELKKLHYLMFFIGLCGIIASAVFTWIQAYKLDAFCKFCLASAFESAVLFIFITLIAFDDKIEKVKQKRKIKKQEKKENKKLK